MASLRVLHSRYGCFRVFGLRLTDFNHNFVKREIIPSCSSSFNSQTQLNSALDKNSSNLLAVDEEVVNKCLLHKKKHLVNFETPVVKNYEELKVLIRRLTVYCHTTFKLFRCAVVLYSINRVSPGFDLEKSEFLNSPECQKLKLMLEDKLHTFSHQQLLFIMRNYSELNIDISSTLIQKLLSLLNDNLHRYSYTEKLQLCIFVHSDKLCEVEIARTIYLKCITEVSNPDKLAEKKTNSLALKYLCYHCACSSTSNGIRCELLKYLLGNTLPEFPFLLHLFRGIELSGKSGRETLRKDLKMAVSGLKEGLKKVKPSEKLDVRSLIRTSHCYLKGVMSGYYEYDEEICDLLSNLIIDLGMRASSVSQWLALMCDIGHVNLNLTKHIYSQLHRSLKQLEPNCLIAMPIICSVVDCFGRKVPGLEECKSHLENSFLGSSPSLLLNANVAMASQGWLWKHLDVLFRQIAEEYKSNNLANFKPIQFFDILLMHLYASIFDTDSVKDFPEEIISMSFTSAYSVLSFHARKTLESIFGGPNYVITKCTNDCNQLFSFAVIVGSKNKPVDISEFQEKSENGFTNVDPILRATGGDLLIIQEFYDVFPVKFRNVNSPTYRTKCFLRLCEAFGHEAFCMESERFYELPNSEQKSFLVSNIRTKFDNIKLND